MKKIVEILCVCLLAAAVTQAAVITGEIQDTHVLTATAGAQGGVNTFQVATDPMRVGRTSTFGGRNAAAVMVFELADLGAGNTYSDVTLTFNVAANVGSMGADLYGIDARAGSAVIASDFYFGNTTDDATDTTKLQDAILTTGTVVGSVTSIDITSWLNTQYDGGNNAGDYVFLRLSSDNTNPNVFNADRGLDITSANAGSNQPTLSYVAIPEPATLGMIALSGVGVLFIRRTFMM